MKFNQICRIGAASVLSLAACLGLTACSRDYTVGFLYVTSSRGSTTNTNGVLNEYGIDYQTGSLIRLASSGQDTGGRNPVAVIVTPTTNTPGYSPTVFVANHDDSNIVAFEIGTDGKLYAKATVTTSGSFPTNMAISGDGKFLYVTFTYQPGFTTASPGPGGIEIFPLTKSSDGFAQLGTPLANGTLNYFPVGYNPVGIAVTSNVSTDTPSAVNEATCTDPAVAKSPTTIPCVSSVYVIDQDTANNNTNNLLAFSRSLVTGATTPIGLTKIGTGTASSTGYPSGILPSAIVAAPLGNYVYLTDKSGNQIIGYGTGAVVTTGAPGAGAVYGIPTAILTGPFATQQQPDAITIDPRGKFLYAANYNSSTVSAFAIASQSGALSAASGTGTSTPQVGTGPTCITIENALGKYLYTSNFLDNTVSGLQLDSATGTLVQIRNTPFPASAGPSCAAATRNGNEDSATQVIQ